MASPLQRAEVPFRMLFLCTHNSARSILSEALANHLGEGRVEAFSAGSQPSGRVNPNALAALRALGIATDGLGSKSWDEFARPGAPVMDLVVTVCGNAAREACPVWPGSPQAVHWGYEDPSDVPGGPDAVAAAFLDTARRIAERLQGYFLQELPARTLARRVTGRPVEATPSGE
jgi:arsenate reductase